MAPSAVSSGGLVIQVIDLFRSFRLETGINDNPSGIATSLVAIGLIPSAPLDPTLAISTRALKFFDAMHLRCPHLLAQAFVKGLCVLHDAPYQPYFLCQFSISYDIYIQIKNGVQSRVNEALERGGDWRLRNVCPGCTYRLEGEDSLVFSMLVTMDGNDSLKRVLRKTTMYNDDGQPVYTSNETPDSRKVLGNYYLSRERVDKWVKDRIRQTVPLHLSEDQEENPCVSRWSNMVNELTARMWAVFNETGIFLALCRHGFVLVAVDMVQSGEMAKYPLSIVESLLDVFGSGIGGGYDIGCKFKTTLAGSELGPHAQSLGYTPLVGSFHGHAHNRLCQLSHLATYVKGLGLEDLEGCERFFLRSNALAASTRHTSPFHRQQQIVEYMKYTDTFETSQNLSLFTFFFIPVFSTQGFVNPGEFLVQNYCQALRIIEGESTLLKKMEKQGIQDGKVFEKWLEEERAYLKGLSQEPIEETMAMEYYQSLVDLKSCREKVKVIHTTYVKYDTTLPAPGILAGPPSKLSARKSTPEKQLKHAEEQEQRLLDKVQFLEQRLELEGERWTESSPGFQQAAVLVSKRRYQRSLDELEQLVVSRVFELTRMNLSQTGYKLRKHIAKALQSRSHGLANALKKYNVAANAMTPKAPTLSWNNVVEYAFLADFDLLRDCRQDICERPWAQPANRVLMDTYFRIQRAYEEIQRLNVEIHCVITHAVDEEAFLLAKEQEIRQSDRLLSHQICRYCIVRTQFNGLHLKRFKKLLSLRGFSGTLIPGVGVLTQIQRHGLSADLGARGNLGTQCHHDMEIAEQDLEEGEHDEQVEQELGDDLEALIAVLS
ncbi:hypothetical protein Agabi119p4_10566 [Agaricus bisporus var. burnettii]|uniref:CxC1-like cysteine cluster associated with KDZ transposases domain-containing protein n=1 Tax=Agaricus bisporus var. burnettii TaxID=192524 RepID=A0A8H7EWQ8_AGABI|nr:hypothetical protein Agabi119p4_10566 [Agaricus bisporus var. burnettii]